MVPLCDRNDSGARKPANEPLPTIQVPLGAVGLPLEAAAESGGNCNGGAVGPFSMAGKNVMTAKTRATSKTSAAAMPMLAHLRILTTAILHAFFLCI
jgi:hypothetical protein